MGSLQGFFFLVQRTPKSGDFAFPRPLGDWDPIFGSIQGEFCSINPEEMRISLFLLPFETGTRFWAPLGRLLSNKSWGKKRIFPPSPPGGFPNPQKGGIFPKTAPGMERGGGGEIPPPDPGPHPINVHNSRINFPGIFSLFPLFYSPPHHLTLNYFPSASWGFPPEFPLFILIFAPKCPRFMLIFSPISLLYPDFPPSFPFFILISSPPPNFPGLF